MTVKPMRMYWWRLENSPKRNFGDEISQYLVREIFGRTCEWASPHSCEIVAAGSIIELALGTKFANRPALWGAGFMREEDDLITDQDFAVAAVRGTRSRERLESGRAGVTVGDPGLLADALLEATPPKKYLLGVVPHFLDAEVAELGWIRAQAGVRVIDATADPRRVVEEIASCETVLSSSLHGLIVADSLGVPNGHLRLSTNQFIGGMYKFRDYYSAFADPDRHFLVSTGRLLAMGVPAVAEHIREHYRPPLDLPSLKENLIKAFPAS